MGFMDKAKKLAEQAQEKLDEAQKNFNKPDSQQAQPGQSVQYDEHGRPIQQETPAAATPPPSATPAVDTPPTGAPPAAGTPAPGAPAPDAPADETPAPSPAPAPESSEGDSNATPDPFKPIQ